MSGFTGMVSDFSFNNLPLVFQYFFVLIVGLSLGSFTTAVIYRVMHGLSWAKASERSVCPECKAILKLGDLVPLFSWLALKGCCRYCKASIPVVYPFTELVAALMVLGAFLRFGLSMEFLWITLAVPFLIALFVIDLRRFILPDQLMSILLGIGILRLGYQVFTLAHPVLIDYVAGFIVYAVTAFLLGWLVSKILKKDALGMGDVKFFAVSGLWLGLKLFPYFLFVAGLLGVIFSLLRKIQGHFGAFPFGPALIASFYMLLLLGSSLWAQFQVN